MHAPPTHPDTHNRPLRQLPSAVNAVQSGDCIVPARASTRDATGCERKSYPGCWCLELDSIGSAGSSLQFRSGGPLGLAGVKRCRVNRASQTPASCHAIQPDRPHVTDALRPFLIGHLHCGRQPPRRRQRPGPVGRKNDIWLYVQHPPMTSPAHGPTRQRFLFQRYKECPSWRPSR